MTRRPVIGIPCDLKTVHNAPFHAVGDKYIQAVQQTVGDVILVPSLADQSALMRLLPFLDGLFLTGSLSNVEPKHYGGDTSRDGTLHDPHRDGTTLPLIRTVLALGMPLLGVCRGFQEMNVALGGTLHQHVQEQPGMMDHREPPEGSAEILYADAHELHLLPGSHYADWMGTDTIRVNSLHQQGIKDLAPGLVAEGVAPDGLIEAFRVGHAKGFAYAVQWHPEWQFAQKPPSMALFKAFQAACLQYQSEKAAA